MAQQQQQQVPIGTEAILPPDPEAAARYMKLVIEDSFQGAPAVVKQALYALAIGNYANFDRFASQYAQVIGKIHKVDLAALNEKIDEFPYEQVAPADDSIQEYLARKRVPGAKEVTTLAAIVYEMGGHIIDVGREVDGRREQWFRATLTYRGVEYTGEGPKKQQAARVLFNNNEPIRHIPSSRSYEEPVEDDPANKQAANLYFQRIGKAVVVNVVAQAGGKWGANGHIDDVTGTVGGQPGKAAAKRKCTYLLYNTFKRQKNVPDTEYRFIGGEPGADENEMEQ